MGLYAPPSSPPPSGHSIGAGPSRPMNNGYAPTITPTPGQPLLRRGKMLVYPHGWKGCRKCNDTGFKNADPTHPCKNCWHQYGQVFNPLLISSSSLHGAKVLQRPLPEAFAGNQTGGMMPGQYPLLGRMERYPAQGNSGYPGVVSQQVTGTNPFIQSRPGEFSLAPNVTGSGSFVHPNPTGDAGYNTPPTLPPRQNEAHDDRPSASREDDLNEDGEAPPAYEMAIAAGPDGALPPQRSEEQHPSNSSNTQSQQHQQYAPPPHHPPSSHGHFSPHMQSSQLSPSQPWNNSPYPMPGQSYPISVPRGHIPPPNALVVRPGDPRIGGQLCFKCGGMGVRESLWFGDSDTCNLCNGSGRIFT